MLLPRMIEALRAVRGDAAVCGKAIVVNHLWLSVAKDTAGPTLRFRRGGVTADHAAPYCQRPPCSISWVMWLEAAGLTDLWDVVGLDHSLIVEDVIRRRIAKTNA